MDLFRTRGVVATTLSLSAIAAAAVVALTVDRASASPAAPTAAALGFNVFAEGNAALTSNESEGPIALGGDLTIGGNFQVGGNSSGTFTVPGDNNVPSALVIGGAVNFAASGQFRLQVQAGAYAKVGNLANADVRNTDQNNASVNTRIVADGASYDSMPRVELTTQQPIASVGPASPINFATAFADFRSSATTLAGCANTVTLTNAQGQPLPSPLPPGTNAFLTLANGVTNVLNITAANLNNIDTLTFQTQPSANAPLLINVDTAGVGNIFNWEVPNQAGIGGIHGPFLLWNFPTATSITQTQNSATLEGTLYAPNASLIDLSSSNNEGQVIVASIVMGTAAANGGEVHYFPFTATLNCGALPAPTIETVASAGVLKGGSVSDTATLTGGQNPTGTITFNLYGPNDPTCTGTVAFTSQVAVAGAGSYPSQSFIPAQAGVYRWVAAYSGDINNGPAVSACNDPNEIVIVTALVTPTIVTAASANVVLGGSVSDTATLTGGQSPTGSIMFNLYGPDDATCTGAVAFTSQVIVAGNGSYPSPSFVPAQAGVYRWVAVYGGDGNNGMVATTCDDPNETVTITAGPTMPTLVTDASPDTYVGLMVSDTATLSGGNQPTGTITFNLYGPDDATCSGPVVFTSTVDVAGDGDYQSGAFYPAEPGTYQWIASYSGDANNAAVSTSCGDPAEQVTVKKKKKHKFWDYFMGGYWPWFGHHIFGFVNPPWHVSPEPPIDG